MAVGHAGWVETFNASPDEGIQKLLSQLPSPDAEHVSQLLDEEVESGAVDRHKLSEYLSLAEPGDEGVHYSIGVALMARLCQRVGSERSEEPGRRFALSLRSGLQSVPLPANLRSARVILRMWAEGFHALHPDVLSGPDVVHAMAFSALMLSHNLHAGGSGMDLDSAAVVRAGWLWVTMSRGTEQVFDEVERLPLAAATPVPQSSAWLTQLDSAAMFREGWLWVREGVATRWERCWVRLSSAGLTFLLTPRVWGLDAEISIFRPLEPLVVVGEPGGGGGEGGWSFSVIVGDRREGVAPLRLRAETRQLSEEWAEGITHAIHTAPFRNSLREALIVEKEEPPPAPAPSHTAGLGRGEARFGTD
ncbi:hypothetical protein T484DRAFT_1759859 [Baffinella frigidus]|nr:hypothetical protein T484DRAFT_1759859 [Cryptophyta sp. CCMP2293]